MANIVRYDPFREMLSLREAANRLFERSFVFPTWSITNATLAPMDVRENEQGYEVKVQLPGVKPEDIELTVRQNILTLKGQHSSTKEEKKENWVVKEIRSGSFGRSIMFDKPIDADKIDTSYENGVLTISVPYSEAGKPKKISVKKEEPKELTEAGAR
ncbi:MAG TPA: Hsp20/alpha crystallin family protein [Ktedonobacteraceae bacterium]